jgi:hypothetical protein
MITISEAKIQLSILEGELDHDNWLNQTIPALKPTIEAAMNRPVFADQGALDAYLSTLSDANLLLDNSIVLNEAMKLAMNMLLGHWFNNRETSSTLTIKEVPLAFDYLVGPYRLINL